MGLHTINLNCVYLNLQPTVLLIILVCKRPLSVGADLYLAVLKTQVLFIIKVKVFPKYSLIITIS